jgi:hypothetical protein
MIGRTNVASSLVAIMLAAATIATAGCSTNRANARDPTESDTQTTTAHGLSVADLLANPMALGFEVDLKASDINDARGTRRLVWRQSDGVRRWDDLQLSGETQGSFTVESSFDASAILGDEAEGCLWQELTDREAHASCSEGGANVPAFRDLESLLVAKIDSEGDKQTVDSRAAHCYTITSGDFGRGVLCIDDQLSAPLLFASRTLTFSDVSIKRFDAALVEPVTLDINPAFKGLNIKDADVDIERSALQLP